MGRTSEVAAGSWRVGPQPGLTLTSKLAHGFYPERNTPFGRNWQRKFESMATAHRPLLLKSRFRPLSRRVNAYGQGLEVFDEAALQNEVLCLREALARPRWTLDVVADGFALIREMAARHLGQRHFAHQLFGGWILLNGMLAEMADGEGKTLTATLPACTMALAGFPVHIVSASDDLVRRDARGMQPLYHALGLTVGVVANGMSAAERRQAYGCDITYCTSKELVFDYLKDRLVFKRKPGSIQAPLQQLAHATNTSTLLLRGLPFAIIDDADSLLIDDARAPVAISGAVDGTYETQVYRQAIDLARELRRDEDFRIPAPQEKVVLTEVGLLRLAQRIESLDAIWAGRRRREDLVGQALTALHLLQEVRDYLVRNGRVQTVDEYTGRPFSPRSWQRGLQQMVEIKEGVEPTARRETLIRISYQRFFRRYQLLAGLTGGARETTTELWSIYGLRLIRVPLHRPVQRRLLPCRLSLHRDDKWSAIASRSAEVHALGRPVLAVTRSAEAAAHLSGLLTAQGIPHQLLTGQQDEDVAQAFSLAGRLGQVTVTTGMVGRGMDIRLGPGVAELGGLHVIATEPNAARRLDWQLFGFCGRRGEPGSCELFASLEDELMAAHFGDRTMPMALVRWLMRRPGSKLSGLLPAMAQRRMERRHYQMRAELLHYDETMEQTLAFSGMGD